MKTSIQKKLSMFIIFLMIMSICVPAMAREYYNYESRYIIQLSDEAFSKMSKVNENLMSIILDDGVSITFATSNYYESLSEEESEETSAKEYTIGSELFAETYNDATYMRDDYFTKRLTNVSGTVEMVDTVLTQINGFDLWEMSYIYLGEPTETEGEIPQTEDAEGENPEGENTDGEVLPELPAPREDGLVQVGEGRMYFSLYKGYMYNIHIICREGKISDYPELESIMNSIQLGRRQSKTMLIMWIVIGVLCVILLGLIVLTVMAKSPKKIAKLRALEVQDAEFDEEEQLRNNEFVNEKLERIAKEHAVLTGPTAEDDIESVDVEVVGEDSEDDSLAEDTIDEALPLCELPAEMDFDDDVDISDADAEEYIDEAWDVTEEDEDIAVQDVEDDSVEIDTQVVEDAVVESEFDDAAFDTYLDEKLSGLENISLTLDDTDEDNKD